jgi:hypothetical protein
MMKLSRMSKLNEVTEIYEKEAQKMCIKRPTVQEMEELFKKLCISTTRNEEALKKSGMRKVSKIRGSVKNEEAIK